MHGRIYRSIFKFNCVSYVNLHNKTMSVNNLIVPPYNEIIRKYVVLCKINNKTRANFRTVQVHIYMLGILELFKL